MSSNMFDRQTVVVFTIVTEALLLLAATVWCYSGQIDLRGLFHFNGRVLIWGLTAGLAISTLNLLILYYSRRLADNDFFFRSMHDLLRNEMIPLFGNLTVSDSILIALASGLCEEIFFRGALESAGGVAISALCFGLAHLPSFYYFPYALWALLVGLLMSFIMTATGSLFAPIVAHALVNLISINVLRYIKN
jgi:membrane protease YdiL (CAAX protease family)